MYLNSLKDKADHFESYFQVLVDHNSTMRQSVQRKTERVKS